MLPAETLAAWLGLPRSLHGGIELVGQVEASGESRASLLATAAGHLGGSMTDGVVSDAALGGLVGRGSVLSPVLPRPGRTSRRGLALHATLVQGQAQLDTISLQASRLALDGHGRLGLADGRLDLHLVADGQLAAASVSLPARVGGTLQDPRPSLDAAAAGGRYALTIGPIGAATARCDQPLRAAREGLPGPMPAMVPIAGAHKAPRGIDILRGLGLLH